MMADARRRSAVRNDSSTVAAGGRLSADDWAARRKFALTAAKLENSNNPYVCSFFSDRCASTSATSKQWQFNALQSVDQRSEARRHVALPRTCRRQGVQRVGDVCVVCGHVRRTRHFSQHEQRHGLHSVRQQYSEVSVSVHESSSCARWKTRDLKSEGQLSIDSSGFRNMHISAGLGGSYAEAKGGIVSATLQIDELRAQCTTPLHSSQISPQLHVITQLLCTINSEHR